MTETIGTYNHICTSPDEQVAYQLTGAKRTPLKPNQQNTFSSTA